MKLRLLGISLVATALVLLVASCTKDQTNRAGAPDANVPTSDEKKGGLPADRKPAGPTAPGFYVAGPYGNVSLHFTAPLDDQVIEGNSVAVTFSITGYPIYKDPDRNKGQHIHVIVDNEPYEADYDPNTPFSPDSFKNLKEGTHTLRAFPSREWHESIKQNDGAAFDFVVFHVKSKTPGIKIDKRAPLLTYSRPKGEYRWKEDPRGVLLDFYVTNAIIGINDYKVKYTLDDRRTEVLNRWEPVWWKFEELLPGEHKVLLELLDKNNKPVPFMVGGANYNRTERKFKILAEGEQPSSAAHAENTNRSHSK
jgi:hypothetical protein